jgi:glutamate synthase domain-containing protein 2
MLSKPARIALAQASRLANTAVHTNEMLPEERLAANLLVSPVFHKNLPFTGHDLPLSEALELHFDQETRMGCHPEADKNNQGISPSRTCQSDMLPEDDLAGIIVKCRQATDQQAPIIFSLGMGRVAEDIRFAVKFKADIVRMKGLADNAGYPLDMVSKPLGIPTIGGLAAAHRTLAENGWENRLDLVIGGGIRNGADVAKALALGAKAVAVSQGALLALGCTGCGSCNSRRCLQGIATQDSDLMKKLDIDAGAQRVYAYLTTLKAEVQQICAVMGKSDVAELGAEDVQATTIEASSMTGLPLVGTGRVF